MIRHDPGATFVLVWCDTCAEWTQPAMSKMHAHLVGANHERKVHPSSDQARDAAWQYGRQHADELRAFRGITEYAVIIDAWASGRD